MKKLFFSQYRFVGAGKYPACLCLVKEPAHRGQAFLSQVKGEVVHIQVYMALHHCLVHLLAVLLAIRQDLVRVSIGVLQALADTGLNKTQDVAAKRSLPEYAAEWDGEAGLFRGGACIHDGVGAYGDIWTSQTGRCGRPG